MNRVQIGQGTFRVLQEGRTDASAWVRSVGATGIEKWIWVAAATPLGDSDRVLTTINSPVNASWAFEKENVNETEAQWIARVKANAPATHYTLAGWIHTKTALPGIP